MTFYLQRLPSPTQMLQQTEVHLAKAKADLALKSDELAVVQGHVDRLTARHAELDEIVHGKAKPAEDAPTPEPPPDGDDAPKQRRGK